MTKPSRRLLSQSLLALASATLLWGAAPSAGAQEVKKAKLGHSFTDAHPRAAAMKQFAASVSKATQGKVIIEVFGNATLGTEDKMLIATQSALDADADLSDQRSAAGKFLFYRQL